MSDDIGERLIKRIENSDTVAMHEIERTLRRLRAELAAERERVSVLQEQYDALLKNHNAERDTLRAELAAAKEEKRQALVGANELLLDVKSAEVKVDGYRGALKEVETERDALCGLLQRARQWLPLKEGIDAELDTLIARIDALLGNQSD